MTLRKPSAERIAAIRAALLGFYTTRRRDLPWRREADPYRVWVAEVMLQQTRVDAVMPYYARWLARFPRLESLANAPLDTVLKAWEGLGYYARARNLHRAARLVMKHHDGRVPCEFASLRALPGVGDYTAGAIASIAFGRAEPAVDGNARRVLCRLLDAEDPAPAALRRVATRLLDPAAPGTFNQALMELGATICTPRSPSCHRCPLAEFCRARRRGTAHMRPLRKATKEVPSFDVGTAVIVARNARVLLRRRPHRGLLAGLWEFPGRITRDGETPRRAASRLARKLVPRSPGRSEPLATLEHAFSHRRETYHVFRFDVPGRDELRNGCVWVDFAMLERYALPAAQRRIATLVGA